MNLKLSEAEMMVLKHVLEQIKMKSRYNPDIEAWQTNLEMTLPEKDIICLAFILESIATEKNNG